MVCLMNNHYHYSFHSLAIHHTNPKTMQNPRLDEDNHIRNYNGADAIQKLKEMAEDARICMFMTYSDDKPMPVRPMALQKVDDDGTLYFFSAASSSANHEIASDPSTQCLFVNTGSSEYLTVFGNATISRDKEKINELWNAWAKAWFHDGPEDPELTLISVTPQSVEYWDTKHNKMVQLIKIAASIVTGKTMDDSVEGKLTI